MAYAYAKNQKELKEKISKKGAVIKIISKTNPRFNLGNEKKYFYTARPKRRFS